MNEEAILEVTKVGKACLVEEVSQDIEGHVARPHFYRRIHDSNLLGI